MPRQRQRGEYGRGARCRDNCTAGIVIEEINVGTDDVPRQVVRACRECQIFDDDREAAASMLAAWAGAQ